MNYQRPSSQFFDIYYLMAMVCMTQKLIPEGLFVNPFHKELTQTIDIPLWKIISVL